jgi:hypothetical protein
VYKHTVLNKIHAACGSYRCWVGKPEGNRQLGRPVTWMGEQYQNETSRNKMGVEWIHLA